MVCTRCGANNSNEALFCQKCGKRLEVINDRPTLPASPYEYSPYTNYGSPEPTYPPPPPTVISENIVKPFTQTHTYNRKIYLTIITALVIMLIGAGILAGIILGRGGFQTNAGNTQSITGVTPTLARVLPTPTHTLSTFTEAPLSDGRLQAWQSAPHAHWIHKPDG